MASAGISEAGADFLCSNCKVALREPYARCNICPGPVLICQKCLSGEDQVAGHLPSHPFIMMRLDFSIFEGNWTAAEELNLTDAVDHYGSNNWNHVAGYLGSKRSAKECKEHYLRNFYSVQRFRTNPAFIPHRASSHDPPRFQSTSVLYNAFSGYNAFRGDFNIEFDNDAENSISDMDVNFICNPLEEWDEDDLKINKELFFGSIEAYRRRLHERQRRKKVITEHGLIQPQKNFLWMRRLDDSGLQWGTRAERQSSSPGVSSQTARTLAKFAQFIPPSQLDSLFEGLKREIDLKLQLNSLYEFRRNGIISTEESSIYKDMVQRKEEFTKGRRKYLFNPVLSWKNSVDGRTGKFSHVVVQPRRPAPPLDITKLPGSEKLNSKERELCSVARIVPDSFIEFRTLLIAECLKQGGLRLAQARSLIKIDVNKTRKLYDFLLEEGSIFQP